MTQQAEALKPCPFCGKSHAARVVSASEMWDVESEGPFPHSETYSVMCDASTDSDLGGCGGAGGYFETSHEAIAAWNRRAPEQLEAQQAAPQAWTVTEEMHVAAVKVLQRANGLDGLPQRMLDAMLAAVPTPQTQEQLLSFEPKKQELTAQSEEHKPQCWCTTCRPITLSDMRFVVCPECGNKRCPRAHNHELACTASNDPGQKGSSWEHVQPRGRDGNQS